MNVAWPPSATTVQPPANRAATLPQHTELMRQESEKERWVANVSERNKS